MEQIYSKKYLLQKLKEARYKYPELNIGASYEALLRYEKDGVIVRTVGPVATSNWRLYTASQVQEIVDKVVEYKKQALGK